MLVLNNVVILKMSLGQGHLSKVYCSSNTESILLFYFTLKGRLFSIEIFVMAVRVGKSKYFYFSLKKYINQQKQWFIVYLPRRIQKINFKLLWLVYILYIYIHIYIQVNFTPVLLSFLLLEMKTYMKCFCFKILNLDKNNLHY